MSPDAIRVLTRLNALQDPRYTDVLAMMHSWAESKRVLDELVEHGALRWLDSGAIVLTNPRPGRRRHVAV